MKYKGLSIKWNHEYCIRKINDENTVCNSLCFYVSDGENKPLEWFDAALNIDIQDDLSDVEDYVRNYIDSHESEYVSFLQRKGWDGDGIAAIINYIEKSEGRELSYQLIKPLDKDGEIIYGMAKTINEINPLMHYQTSDNGHIFTELSKFDLLKYAEAEKYGECTYNGGCLDTITIDYLSTDYQNYEIDLLAETMEIMLNKEMSLEEITEIQANFNSYFTSVFSYKTLHPMLKKTYSVQEDIESLKFQNKQFSNEKNLPECCYSLLPSGNEIIFIKRYEKDYYNVNSHFQNQLFGLTTRQVVNNLNANIGVTRSEEQAMLFGFMSGWDVADENSEMYKKNEEIDNEDEEEL